MHQDHSISSSVVDSVQKCKHVIRHLIVTAISYLFLSKVWEMEREENLEWTIPQIPPRRKRDELVPSG